MGPGSCRSLTSSAVSRRIAAVVIALVAALTLSSCGSATQTDVVARVGDTELTRDDLQELLNNRIVQEALQTGELDGDKADMTTQAERVISIWIALEAFQTSGAAALDGDASADAVLSSLPGDYRTQFDTAGQRTQDLITRYIAFQNQYSANSLDRTQLSAAVQAADVHVDSRYGYWDPAQASVVPFGQAATPTT